MQPIDIVIYSVVLMSVILACAQHVICEPSDGLAEVPLMNKVINLIAFLAAGFSLLGSPMILGDVKGSILGILVVAMIAVAVIAGKLVRSRAPQSEKTPIPEDAINSHKPDPTLGWCGNCKAHTLPGDTVVTMHNGEVDGTTTSYRTICCGYCQARMLWNVPSETKTTTNWTLGSALVVGLVTALSWTAFAQWKHLGGLMIGLVSVPILIGVLAMLIWFLFLRWQWCKWLSQHPQTADE